MFGWVTLNKTFAAAFRKTDDWIKNKKNQSFTLLFECFFNQSCELYSQNINSK